MKQTLLKSYIRDANRQPRGVAVAIREGDEVFYGFSLLNVKMDKFDRDLGITIAVNRAMANSFLLPKTPEREQMVLDAFKNLESRAIRYFKDLSSENIRMFDDEGNPNIYELI